MAIRSLRTASISTGSKRSKFWDQSAVIAGDFEAIASTTISSSGTQTITFNNTSNAWGNYTHLQARWVVKNDRAAANDTLLVYLNGDTSDANYVRQWQEHDGANNSTSYQGSGASFGIAGLPGATYSNYFGTGYANFFDINNSSKNKTFFVVGAFAQSGTASGQNNHTMAVVSYITSTTNITSISFKSSTGLNFVSGTKVALYGIRG